MNQLTPNGQQVVADLSQRYGFSADATTHMLFAVTAGRGSMAQFNHPEFGGSGQWMQGGMIMLGDMFNHGLKGRVDGLCNELSTLLANEPSYFQSPGSFQAQSQGDTPRSQPWFAGNSLIAPDPAAQFWPKELGHPSATGAQNQVQYAYFQPAHRLVVQTGNDVWVYDTLDHQIGGFSQQQGSNQSILFNSQYGVVNLATLPVLSRNGQAVTITAQPDVAAPAQVEQSIAHNDQSSDVLATLERLGDLKAKGLLTEEEFASKKAELLSRL